MRNKSTKVIFTLLVLVLIGWIIKDTFTQSGIKDLRGGFVEKASYRNQNNTGPIQRIYVVSVKDSANAQLIEYGNLMPHTKYGNTKVYYFLATAQMPTALFPGEENFDAQYRKDCFALYEKSAMGNVGLIKNPFK